jgi:hypothetical protein
MKIVTTITNEVNTAHRSLSLGGVYKVAKQNCKQVSTAPTISISTNSKMWKKRHQQQQLQRKKVQT